MSFAEYETSLQNGRPVRLYQFQRGPLKWGYTSTDRNMTFQSVVFRTIEGGINDDGIRQTEDSTADLLTLTAPFDIDIAQMYRFSAPSQKILVTIFDHHFGDNDFLVVWMGEVTGVRFKDSAQIQCKNLSASLERTGLRKAWARHCQHQLYSQSCSVSRNAFKSIGQIDRIDGSSIGFSAAIGKPNEYFSGGYIEWTTQYGLEQRGIEQHQNDSIFILGGTTGLVVGQELAVYAGCNRLLETCKSRFNNVLNYGGSPHMPGKSPFDGTPAF